MTSRLARTRITKIRTDESGKTGAYYGEGGVPMLGSALVLDPKVQDRIIAETGAPLSAVHE